MGCGGTWEFVLQQARFFVVVLNIIEVWQYMEILLHFNDHVAADARVQKLLLPLRDGLTIIRKK